MKGDSIVKQRELGRDVLSYSDGLQSAMRQGADVIVVDLVEDAQTMRAVCRAVETGHLVMAVVNSRTALDAMYRIASFFGPELQDCERYRLSVALHGTIALLVTISPEGEEEQLTADITVIDNAMRTGIAIGDYNLLH